MKLKFFIYGLSGLLLLFFAARLGPRSCEGGFDTYFVAGILFLLLSVILPFIKNPAALRVRLLQATGLGAVAVLLWIAGFLLGNFRIICRLF